MVASRRPGWFHKACPPDEPCTEMRHESRNVNRGRWIVLPLVALLALPAPFYITAAAESGRPPTSTGIVVANRSVVLAAKIIGRVAAVNAEEADRVDKDDIVVDIGDAELRADLAAAEARLKREEINLSHMDKLAARVKKLYAQNAASAENLDDASFRHAAAREQVANARAAVAKASAMLGETKIRAPFAGIVIDKRVEVGSLCVTQFHPKRYGEQSPR